MRISVGTQQRSEFNLHFLVAIALIRMTDRDNSPRRSQSPQGTGWRPVRIDFSAATSRLGRVAGPGTASRLHPAAVSWRISLVVRILRRDVDRLGAHHVDIAHWGLGMDDTGPTTIDATGTLPNIPNGYNTATDFHVNCACPNNVEMVIRSTASERVGVLFEGDRGRIFVNRGGVRGKPVEQLADDPLAEDALVKVYGGRQPGNHMRNFFDCVRERAQPISDVFSHHRALTTCHLANISLRLGRKLEWDPIAEQIVGDDEANGWLSRTQRTGYEI